MRLHNTILISICENNRHGTRSGKATRITVDSYSGEMCLDFEPVFWPESIKCLTDSGRVVEIHDNRFKFTASTDMFGNILWNGYYFPPDYGLGLINMLIRSKQWSVTEGWSDLITKIEAGELITGKDLEFDEDYQPMCLNPNQYEIPFFNQTTEP